jgi:hypothetical protein
VTGARVTVDLGSEGGAGARVQSQGCSVTVLQITLSVPPST